MLSLISKKLGEAKRPTILPDLRGKNDREKSESNCEININILRGAYKMINLSYNEKIANSL